MKVILFHILFTLLFVTCNAQYELVPYGDFEYPGAGEVAGCPVDGESFFWPVQDSWTEIGHFSGYAPTFFSAEFTDGSLCDVPTNSYGTQIPQGGISVNKNYVGMQSGGLGGRRDGIKTKLSHPLRQGQQYVLRFDAVKKSNSDPEIEFRFGSNNDWEQAGCPSCSQSFMTISADGGVNNDEWASFSVSFIANDCDIEWLFIRMQSSVLSRKVLIDNISINDPCTAYHLCRGDFGSLDDVSCSNVHDAITPLTFFGCERIEDFTLEITPVGGQDPVRTIHVYYPNSTLSWDGRDDNGNYVANAIYTYTLDMKNSCQCRVMSHDFVKTDNPHLITSFATTEVNYGLFTVFQLQNVTQLYMEIKDDNYNLVSIVNVPNPSNAISWSGQDASGDFVAEGYYHYDIDLANPCESVHLDGLFYQVALGPSSLSSPNLDYSSYSKVIVCPYVFNYYSYDYAPLPCCPLTADWFIINKHITGIQDYKVGHNIIGVQDNVIEAGSDIYFQAGNEIILNSEFEVEMGSEFEAVILPCTGRMQNPLDSNENSENSNVYSQQHTTSGIEVTAQPNPGEGIFELNMAETANGPVLISVTDILGREVLSKEFSQAESNNLKLDLSGKGPGIYCCTIIISGEVISILKLIVQ